LHFQKLSQSIVPLLSSFHRLHHGIQPNLLQPNLLQMPEPRNIGVEMEVCLKFWVNYVQCIQRLRASMTPLLCRMSLLHSGGGFQQTPPDPRNFGIVESKDTVVGKLHALYPKVESINDSFAFQDVIAARWLLSANTTRS